MMINPDDLLFRIETRPRAQEYERRYLGASEIGEECNRKLWLKFHGYAQPEQFSDRMLRLFKRGIDEELRFESYLDSIGIEIVDTCRSQAGFKDGFFAGHGDGVYLIDGDRVCGEMKTHSVKSFATLKRGELKFSHPKHYAQCIVYTGKFNCKYALYMAVCKDTDELFFDCIPFNQEEFDAYLAKAEYITMADKPPERIATKPTAFACKFCHVKDICWGFEMPRVDCRNCTSATKHQEFASFGCDKIQKSNDLVKRSSNNQLDERGYCESHSFNPYAMHELQGWEPLEFHPQHRAVEYKKPDGETIINGEAPFGVPSKDLRA
ncbi:MAG: hypothetical protein EPO08_21180 [Rhodospirillaceae bacterium]|nr:MAG: hypothetical protein EPO08_21180 [Rhodospirillaceae bacterium]